MNTTETTTLSYNQPREWLLWTLAMIGGWLLGAMFNILASILLSATGLSDALRSDPSTPPPQDAVLMVMGISLVLLAVIGLGIGLLQEMVLRRLVPGLQRWALFTAAGFAVGAFLTQWAPYFLGLGVGITQWLLLRRDLNRTGWWPVMNVLAWPLGSLFGGGLGVTIGDALGSPLVGNLLGFALTGAIIGALTGAVLMWMLRQNAVLLEGLRQERAAAAKQAKS